MSRDQVNTKHYAIVPILAAHAQMHQVKIYQLSTVIIAFQFLSKAPPNAGRKRASLIPMQEQAGGSRKILVPREKSKEWEDDTATRLGESHPGRKCRRHLQAGKQMATPIRGVV